MSDFLILHPAPAGLTGASGCTVTVNGRPVFVYEITVHDGVAPMVCFDFRGAVTVEVRTNFPVHTAEIRPRALGIRASVEGHVVRFVLTQPRKFVVEFNDRRIGALHVFANPVETDAPQPDDPNVRYFGPGVHEAGEIRLASNQTIYLAGGAYVYGNILGERAEKACIRGRGILDGRKQGRKNLVSLVGCSDVEVRDVILLDCQCWVFHIQQQSRRVRVENVKIVNHYRGGTDGIDINASREVTIRDCFIRDCDDNIVLKSFLEGAAGDVRQVEATDCVLWSDGCRALQIGLETRCDFIEDVLFRNIDIIHHLDITHPVLSISIGDRAHARRICFEEIRIEDAAGSPLIDFWVGKSYYTLDAQKGRIEDVTVRNVSLLGGPAPRVVTSWGPHADERLLGIYGCADDHAVAGVTIENLHVFGRYAGTAEAANIQVRDFVRDLRFSPPADGAPVASFRMDPATPPMAGQVVRYDASESFAPGGRIVSHRFDFGDGVRAAGPVADHCYAAPGHYPVQLTVTDEAGRVGHARAVVSAFALHAAQTSRSANCCSRLRLGEDASPPLSQNGATDDKVGRGVLAGPGSREGSVSTQAEQGQICRFYDREFTLAAGDALATVAPVRTVAVRGVQEALSARDAKAVRVEGFLDVPETGVYTFFLDGAVSRLRIDGSLVTEADFLMATWTNWGRIGLAKGRHSFELSGSLVGKTPLKVEWEGPGVTLQVLP